MSSAERPSAAQRVRLFDFRSGGWVLLVAGLLVLGIIGWQVGLILSSPHRVVIGDGTTVASYGFDLEPCLIPRSEIVAAGFPKDGLPVYGTPAYLTIDQLTERARQRGGKFLVSSDRVIGLEINGVARCYQLEMLAWHQVINDVLADEPIAVTYDPLCDSSVVFARNTGAETLEFGVSGLLYNSNLLLFDRRPNALGESLWSQLQFRAIAGPAAAESRALRVLPASVMTWAEWRTRHPNTTVLARIPELRRVYQRTYNAYFGSDELRFAVAPLPPASAGPLKTPTLAVWMENQWRSFRLPDVARQVDRDGRWKVPETAIQIRYHDGPPVAWVESADLEASPPPSIMTFWFAWYAMHPAQVPTP